MKKILLLSLAALSTVTFSFAQGVGINATGAVPHSSAMLHVDAGTSTTKGLLVTGTYNASGTVPDLGAGSRLMFYPAKAAFRSGYVTGTQWDNINVGLYSVAMGNNTIASGFYSTAIGNVTTANGNSSTAMGINTVASGIFSTAMGRNTIASGANSTAMGSFTTASGNNSTAMGNNVSTNLKNGAFIIGDAFGTGSSSSADNEMTMGFLGGFRLYTNSGATSGVLLPANGNAWLSVSDINRKENFEPLDGEEVLQKISKIEFTSWNYKQQDPKIYRHYGIMAQDFYKAFGHDQFGTVGNDTTVNPIDMIGIDMTAIQALEKRTVELKNENERLKTSVAELQKKFTEQQKLIEQILNNTKP